MNIPLRVKNLTCRHQTRDPFKIAKDLGIIVQFKPYENTKGYFIKVKTNKFIVINSNLDEFSQLVVCAHELGHALYHSNITNQLIYEKGMTSIMDYTLFPNNSIHEQEANKFAAELLIHENMALENIVLAYTNLDLKTYETLLQLKTN